MQKKIYLYSKFLTKEQHNALHKNMYKKKQAYYFKKKTIENWALGDIESSLI